MYYLGFLEQLPAQTATVIEAEAEAIDIGLSYQKLVRESLPNADIVFDHFHHKKIVLRDGFFCS